MKPTKKALLVIRKSTYVDPPPMRCETCKHFNQYGPNCLAVEVRGMTAKFPVHAAGFCDLYTAKQNQPAKEVER